MNPNKIKTLFQREIRDILRDKKTLVMMIVLPLLLYPLMIVGATLLMTSIMASQEEKTYYVAFEGNHTNQYSYPIEQILEKQEEKIGYHLEILEVTDIDEALNAGKIDCFVKVNDDASVSLGYLSAKDKSQTAVSAIEKAFSLYKEELREQTILSAGLDPEVIMNPIYYDTLDRSTTEESVGNIIGSIMPFLIITSILLGAIYPAIDVTAGEKERGTLETLLTLPVTNFELIMSKFLAVSVIACVSAILNICSMAGAVLFLVTSSLSSVEGLNVTIRYQSFIPGILFSMVVMLFFALFVTAVCMCVCVFAKSFKEANNYITPVMLVFMFSSYVTMLPDLELTKITASIPVVNVALMIDSLFQFQYNYGLFGIVLFSNVAFSLLAIFVLSRIYDSESVLFSDGFTSVRIFKNRKDMKQGQMPGNGDLVLLLSIVLLLIFYIGTIAQVKLGFGGVFVQQLIILLCPLAYAYYMKADMKKLFSIRKPKISQLFGALLLMVSAFLVALIVGALLTPIMKESGESLVNMDQWFATIQTPILLVVVALMPAMGEELLFRGFVMGTLKDKYKASVAILVTTLIFAAYHMSLIKMFTIFFIGGAMCYAAYQSKSIFVSMLMHFCNNGFSVLMVKYPEVLRKIVPFLFAKELQVIDYIVITVLIVVCGILGFYILHKNACIEE